MSQSFTQFVKTLSDSLSQSDSNHIDIESELLLLQKEISHDTRTIPFEILKEYISLKNDSIRKNKELENLTEQLIESSNNEDDESLSEKLFEEAAAFETKFLDILSLKNTSRVKILKLATEKSSLVANKKKQKLQESVPKKEAVIKLEAVELISEEQSEGELSFEDLLKNFSSINLEIDKNAKRKEEIKKEISKLKENISIQMKKVIDLDREYKELG